MANEKELKYLVANDSWKSNITGSQKIEQGFLTPYGGNANVVRIRIIDNKSALLTLKGVVVIDTDGLPTKKEFEYPVPLLDAREQLLMCESKVIKTRYIVPDGQYEWEVDVFEDSLSGLVVAELEEREGVTPFPPKELPAFVGKDVSLDMRYTNVSLAYKGLPVDNTPQSA